VLLQCRVARPNSVQAKFGPVANSCTTFRRDVNPAASGLPAIENGLPHDHLRNMSRAFVKEDDAVDDLPDRPVSTHPNDVTEAGLAQIKAAAEEARAGYARAQAEGDRAALARHGRDLRYWTARLVTAQVVPSSADTSEVRFGHTVTIRRDDGREQSFRIVGEDEASPGAGSISHASPLARALFGKRVGDTVRAGTGEAEITSIRA
jgi:transcription elongation GreA/GreB family factor